MHFSSESTAIIYGVHLDIVQHMLDYDFLTWRWPSIKALISPVNTVDSCKVFYWDKEFFLPVIRDWDAIEQLWWADMLINLASFRTASSVTMEAIQSEKFKSIFVIAEWIPEQDSLMIQAYAKQSNVQIFGPAIVWAILPGIMRIWHTGWSLDNILASQLWKAGSVWLVSKSWWMMNELCRMISNHTDWIYAAFQIGWDRFPASSFADIVRYYQSVPSIRMIVLLWEVWNLMELEVAQLIRDWVITKPVVARCLWSSAWTLSRSIQFGHAWAQANSDHETAQYKNNALRDAWAYVPESFVWFAAMIESVFWEHCGQHQHITSIPISIHQAVDVLTKRHKTRFTTTISDERGDELLYNNLPISHFVEKQSIAHLLGHLRLKQALPDYALEFINTVLILLADHGPAVSGATNSIIAARAWKDCVSSLIAWLATIWSRFGWAITWAAQSFFDAVRGDITPTQYVQQEKAAGRLIQWIGHKVKSLYNPDKRCEHLVRLSESFPVRTYLTFGLAVQALTTQKKPTLILNVDGHIACMLLDMFASMEYTNEQIQQYIDADFFNALFVLARSVWFLAHHIDQYRLQEWLYRTPWDDILYCNE